MKALLIAVSEGLPRQDLASAPIGSVAASRRVAESVLPGQIGEQLPDGELSEYCYPNKGVYVGTFGSTWLVSSQNDALLQWEPANADSGRNAYRVFMHSVVSTAGHTYWGADGTFREFAGSWEDGVLSSEGAPLPFEVPFWGGDMDDDGEAAQVHGDEMPFNPMDLGEEALREFFGFVGEGVPRPDDVDAEQILLHGFQIISPPATGGWLSRLRRRR